MKYNTKRRIAKRNKIQAGFLIIYFSICWFAICKASEPILAETYIQVEHEKEVQIYPEPDTEVKRWVLTRIYEAGLNPSEAECIIDHESKWNEWATNWNTNETIDYGLWQINSIHKASISVEDRYDYKKATEWAIQKRLNDGNWNAWTASKFCK